jgi:hypothetical protein
VIPVEVGDECVPLKGSPAPLDPFVAERPESGTEIEHHRLVPGLFEHDT